MILRVLRDRLLGFFDGEGHGADAELAADPLLDVVHQYPVTWKRRLWDLVGDLRAHEKSKKNTKTHKEDDDVLWMSNVNILPFEGYKQLFANASRMFVCRRMSFCSLLTVSGTFGYIGSALLRFPKSGLSGPFPWTVNAGFWSENPAKHPAKRYRLSTGDGGA